MQPSTRDTAKGFAAVIAATGFVIALILSAPAYARHGGDNYGRPSATPTYDAWVAQSKTDETPSLRQEAALDTVMTDAVQVTEPYQVPTTSTNYGKFFRFGR